MATSLILVGVALSTVLALIMTIVVVVVRRKRYLATLHAMFQIITDRQSSIDSISSVINPSTVGQNAIVQSV